MRRRLTAVDLFAGAGGASTGLAAAVAAMGWSVDLVAVNHWDVAIATHQRNHPHARHYHAPVETLDPRQAVPGGRVDLLIAAPECTHHSMARGGRPIHDQSRASAWHVLRWLELLRVEAVLIENVPEFATWGPLDAHRRPIKSRKGETFRAYLAAIASLGYAVDWRILNSADYGEAQTRKRLFIQARRLRTGGAIAWPDQTHAPDAGSSLLRRVERWRPARDVIDWSLPSPSIFTRRRPLAVKTLARIAAGAERFWGVRIEPFLVPFLGEAAGQAPRVRSIDDPMQTVTSSNPIGLCEPFILQQQSGGVPRAVGDPLPTLAASGAVSLIEPFLVRYNGTGKSLSTDNPLPTVTAKDRYGLVQAQHLDIGFRMLQPHELAAAMGFPADYEFTGNKTERVRQIGNAISVRTMQALCSEVLQARRAA